MENAKTELLKELEYNGQSLETIDYGYFHLEENKCEFDGTIRSHQLAMLDKEYNSGYGLQKLDGIIVFKDGTWLSRSEYDGSEWWNYNKVPSKGSLLSTVVDTDAIASYRKRIADPKTPKNLIEHYESMIANQLACEQ